MLFKSVLAVAALAGSALAGFDIKTGQQTWWYTDDAQVCTQPTKSGIAAADHSSPHPLLALSQPPMQATKQR
jgi:hypothetical protein